MSSANVRSVQTLTDVKTALAQFAGESQAALQRMEVEARRTLEWLDERRRHWEGQVRRCEEIAQQALAALQRCQASASRDPKTGRVYAPDCSGPEATLRQAVERLREAQSQLANVRRWAATLQESGAAFQRQAQRQTRFVEKEGVEAQAFLERRVAALEAYASVGLSGIPFTTTLPVQAASDTFAAGIALGAVGLTVAAISVIKWMAGPIRQTLGDAGEALTARLLSEQPGWQELPFDQPKHGFDRLFSAPGLPLIVVESKVHGRGEFHPGQPQSGAQGSPEWIAAQAARMADPDSKQWSPVNERIAALIQEMGPESLPVVAVVIETGTGRAAIHYRTPSTDDWQTLEEGVSLDEALQGEGRTADG